MTFLQDFLAKKRENGDKILSIYLTAGFPNAGATLPLLQTIEQAGADLIELGVPFSDPQADGPTIQAASFQALQNGMTLQKTLDIAEEFKRTSKIPLILMGYANPFMQFGWKRLLERAKTAGIDGYIVPDLPPEEAEEVRKKMNAAGQSLVYLVSPNTSPGRIALIAEKTTSFIYAVSLTGITGARKKLPQTTVSYLNNLAEETSHPILVGFGVSNAETARSLSQHADGVIIGSAIINLIAQNENLEKARDVVGDFLRQIKSALTV